MDPLAAIGLGANIFQIIDLGVRLVGLTRDVINTGDVYNIYGIHQTSAELVDLIRGLSQADSDCHEDHLASTEKPIQALKSLAQDCKIEAEAIESRLETFRSRTSGKTSKKAALKAAAVAMWNKSEIESMALRLDRYRSQLGLRMLDVINVRSAKQGTSIVEILSMTQRIDSSVQTIAALLNSGDGSVDTILGHTRPTQANSLTDTLSITYQKNCSTMATQGDGSQSRYHAASPDVTFAQVAKKIVNSLWFAFMRSREDMVDDPFKKTLNWISNGQGIENNEWDSFPDWLRTGTGCYWISGKAGSGKSTLMKYVAGHPVLARCLEKWAGDDHLVKASFFFWRAGIHPLQKSQEGLLRSLLLQILDKRRELITVCFPALCHTLMSTKRYREELRISFDQLKVAFGLLAKCNLPKTKIFLLIDGLDEYQGDHRYLVSLLSHAIESPSMKVLVSSRPIPLLFQAFNRCPRLEIHNLTLNDIRHYAEERLYSDNTLTMMDQLEPGISHQITEIIVSKASGVFLWVTIVVKDLLYGLAHHDSRETLLRNIDKLPTDLEQLYDYMFASMTPLYRREAARLIRLTTRSQEVQFDYPMTALQLAFTQMCEPEVPQNPHWRLLSESEENAHCELVEGRLRSRCCGLLEVQKSYWGPQDSRKYIGFLHRTVLDYLERDEIQAQLLSWDSTSTRIDEVLFWSGVMEVRQYTQRNAAEYMLNAQPRCMSIIPQLHKRAPSTGVRILHTIFLLPILQSGDQKIFDEVFKEMTQAFSSLPPAEHEEVNKLALAKAIHPSLQVLHATNTDLSQGFWVYAAMHGIGIEIACQPLSGEAFHHVQSSSLALFNNLIHLSHPISGSTSSRVARGTIQLLTAGVDPNEPCLFFGPRPIENTSAAKEIEAAVRLSPSQDTLIPWIFWLSCKKHRGPLIVQDYLLYMKILACMITAGASLQGSLGSSDPDAQESIYSVVKECIASMSDASQEALDLRNHIQLTVRDITARLPSNENSRPVKKTGKSWKIPLRLTRRRDNSVA